MFYNNIILILILYHTLINKLKIIIKILMNK